jgi:hypothetical protein
MLAGAATLGRLKMSKASIYDGSRQKASSPWPLMARRGKKNLRYLLFERYLELRTIECWNDYFSLRGEDYGGQIDELSA